MLAESNENGVAMHKDVEALGRALHAFWSMRRDNRVPDGIPASVTELTLLRALDEDGPSRVSDLATRTCVDTSVASRQVAHLESMGLVDRTPDADDRRSHLVRLTPQGVDALKQWRAEVVRRWADALDGWSGDDIRSLTRTLNRLHADLIDSRLFRGPSTTHDSSLQEGASA
jgi:DNA-binding MarR family transcriptional regulator